MIVQIPVKIYKTQVYVFIDEPEAKIKSWVKRHTYADADQVCEELSFDGDEAALISYNDSASFIRFQNRDTTVGIVAHELLHATMFILFDRHVRPEMYNHEAFAYLLEYLTDEFYKKYAIPG